MVPRLNATCPDPILRDCSSLTPSFMGLRKPLTIYAVQISLENSWTVWNQRCRWLARFLNKNNLARTYCSCMGYSVRVVGWFFMICKIINEFNSEVSESGTRMKDSIILSIQRFSTFKFSYHIFHQLCYPISTLVQTFMTNNEQHSYWQRNSCSNCNDAKYCKMKKAHALLQYVETR